jgi:glycosyltransferase involved in cell wall biosynthesis
MFEENSSIIDKKFDNTNVFFYNFKFKSNINSILNFKSIRRLFINLHLNKNTIFNFHLKVSEIVGVLSTIFFKDIKRFIVYHSFYNRYFIQSFFIRNFIDIYIAVSNESKNQLVNSFGISPTIIHVIYNGIDTTFIESITDSNNDNKTIKFISVGRFTKQKNFLLPVNSFLKISYDFSYTLIGFGPQFNKIKKIASKNSGILLKGPLPRTQTLEEVSNSDLVVIPSLHEGNSIFLLESLAMNKPLFLSDIESFKEYFAEPPLKDHELFRVCKWGILFKNNTNSLITAINFILHNKNKIDEFKQYIKSLSNKVKIDNVSILYFECYKRQYKL